jgi:hypothetical protein
MNDVQRLIGSFFNFAIDDLPALINSASAQECVGG